jgi:hypothetical protein
MKHATPWQRLTGRGMYPVEYARWLLNPLRRTSAASLMAAAELDEVAALSGLAKGESWSGLLVQTFNNKNQSRWRRELQEFAGRKIKKLAGFGAARQAQRQDFLGYRLGCRQRHRIFSGHDLRSHPGPRRSRIE